MTERTPSAALIPILVGGIALVVIGILMGIAPEYYFAWLDKPLLMACRQQEHAGLLAGPSWLPGAARDVTSLGSGVILSFVAVSVTCFLLAGKLYRSAAIYALATSSGSLLMSLLKFWFSRVRPAEPPALEIETGFSFPSGHAMMSVVIYLCTVMVMEQRLARAQRVWIAVCCGLLLSAIGVSRVVLGVHYPSDVLAGWSIGTGLTMCWWWVLRSLAVSDRRSS